MIVGRYFENDHGAFSWAQHDRYREALGIIVRGCEAHLRRAREMLGLRDDVDLPMWFDHRVLQLAHDLVAAAWRFRFDQAQLHLFGKPMPRVDDWLCWLTTEVRSWSDQPQLVGAIRNSLRFENSVAGYAAEARAANLLLGRFNDVPWADSWRAVIEADYH